RDHRLVDHVEWLVEVDVLLVERIPEMVVSGRDNLVECRRALLVAVELDHRLEIVGRDRAVHLVLGDVGVGHGVSPRMRFCTVLPNRAAVVATAAENTATRTPMATPPAMSS